MSVVSGVHSSMDEETHILDEAKKHVDKGIYLWNRRKYDESIAECKRGVALRLSVLGVYHEDTAGAYCWIGYSYYWKSQLDKALNAFRIYLRTRRALSGDPNKPSIQESTYIQKILEKKGYSAKQIETFNRHINVSIALEKDGDEKRRLGEYRSALELYKQAIATEKRSFGGTENQILAILWRKYAFLSIFEDHTGAELDWNKADLIKNKWFDAFRKLKISSAFDSIRSGDLILLELNFEKAIEQYYLAAQAAKEARRAAHQDNLETNFSILSSRESALIDLTSQSKEAVSNERPIMDQCLLDLVERVEKIGVVVEHLSEKVTKIEQRGSKPDEVHSSMLASIKETRGLLVSQFSTLKSLAQKTPPQKEDKVQLQIVDRIKTVEELLQEQASLIKIRCKSIEQGNSPDGDESTIADVSEEKLMNLVSLIMKQQEIVQKETLAQNEATANNEKAKQQLWMNMSFLFLAFLSGLFAKRNFLLSSDAGTGYSLFDTLRQPLLCLLAGMLCSSIPAVRNLFDTRTSPSKKKSTPS